MSNMNLEIKKASFLSMLLSNLEIKNFKAQIDCSYSQNSFCLIGYGNGFNNYINIKNLSLMNSVTRDSMTFIYNPKYDLVLSITDSSFINLKGKFSYLFKSDIQIKNCVFSNISDTVFEIKNSNFKIISSNFYAGQKYITSQKRFIKSISNIGSIVMSKFDSNSNMDFGSVKKIVFI